MLKKALILSIIIIALSTIFVPFSLKADYYNTAPFVGINYYVEDYDNENRVSLNSGNTTLSLSGSQTNTLLVQRTTNGVTYVTSTYSQGGVSGNGGSISLSGNINLNSTITNTQVVYRVIKFQIVLDNNYIGYIRPRVTVSGNNTNLFQQDLAVNGNSVDFSIVDNNVSTTASYSVTWSDFNLIQNNDERWSFPVESFNIINSMFDSGYSNIGINRYNDYLFPIFSISNSKELFNVWVADDIEINFIFGINQNINQNNFFTYFSVIGDDNNSLQLVQYDYITTFINNFKIVKYVLKNNSGSGSTYHFKYLLSSAEFMPIYSGYNDLKNISTDFALQFGLTNDLLDNLNIVANGNTTSNQSSSSADQMNQQAQTTFQQEEQLVNNAENDLQSNLQSLDIQNQNNNLFGNSKFIASASWVKTQFDTLTNNNAFGYLITFSLVIGLSLVIVGKLRS